MLDKMSFFFFQFWYFFIFPQLFQFSCSKKSATCKAQHMKISSSINLLFLMSDVPTYPNKQSEINKQHLSLTSFLFRINTNCSCFLLNCCPLIYIIPFHSLINEVCLQIVARSQDFTIILALNICLKCGRFLPIGFEFETTYVMHAYVIFS